ncbi:hypothetical protein I2I05_18930 [Hymenobacter sp. BT683]|uniref:Uncharacterized protein n=1 Tax=Hymenobacter jeongseonensis TaxID=2791027 RepID=A0ABS0IM86_9BACT|nr:hypothetical protein [Hymenobacter jeongseonensis]MBF9239475.1 hypothetical protein [Hymenobacter jeongseonensis]
MPYDPNNVFAVIAQYIVDNVLAKITPAHMRLVLAQVVADARQQLSDRFEALTTNQVKGALFRVPTILLVNGQPTIDTALIPVRSRILGMDARATNGTDAATAGAGVKVDPMDFRLIYSSTGPIDALVDELPTTTATVKARWVRTSGTEEERILSYPVLQLEDQDYVKGEVVQHTFAALVPPVTRLLEWREASVGFQHPVPTGLDDDPIYKPFAPLTAPIYDDTALKARVSAVEGALPAKADLVGGKVPAAQLPAGQNLANTDALAEGAANKYFTDARAQAALASALAGKMPLDVHTTLNYSPTIVLDFNAANVRSITLSGNLEFLATLNKADTKSKVVRVIADGTNRTMLFPSAWRWTNNSKPSSLAATKFAILTLWCFGANEADVVATWSPE